jgi:hypothetical protein
VYLRYLSVSVWPKVDVEAEEDEQMSTILILAAIGVALVGLIAYANRPTECPMCKGYGELPKNGEDDKTLYCPNCQGRGVAE